LLAIHGLVNERKALLADRWVSALPALSHDVKEIVGGRNRSTLQHFGTLVHGAPRGVDADS
jgi:hypothetical protein